MMRITISTVLALVTVASATISPPQERKEAFDREFVLEVPADSPRDGAISKALRTHAACKDSQWKCQKACYAQIPITDNHTVPHCIKPAPGETCFGRPIDYKYVPSKEQLPAEYEVLKRFPKCWSVLGPMLCGLIYRPCGVFEFSARLSLTKTKMEIWQRFGVSMCKRTQELCADAIQEGLFPSELIDCTRTSENDQWIKQNTNATGALASFVPSGNEEELRSEWNRKTAFTEDKCNIKYNENASRHEPMQCIFPLVYTKHEKIQPVIDDCFLPCSNSLISSQDKLISFRIIRAVICVVFAFICIAIFMFLSARSKIYANSHAIFSIASCLLCFSVYLVVWGLGSIPDLAESSECTRTAHGVNIRSTPTIEFASSWCLISAVTMHVSLLCSIGFLAAAYPLSTAGVEGSRAKKSKKNSTTSSGFRIGLVSLITVVSLLVGFGAVLLKMVSTDGVSGVCAFGLHSIIDHLTTVALPGLVFCLIALAVGLRNNRRETKRRQTDVKSAIAMEIGHRIEKAKKKSSEDSNENKNRQDNDGLLPAMENKDGESGKGGEMERNGEDDILVLQRDCDEEEWLSDDQKRAISDSVRNEMDEERTEAEKKARYESISSRYTLVALSLCIFSLLFGLVVHWIFLANNGRQEYDAVREYVTCVMSKSITRKDAHWMSEPAHESEKWMEGRGENDPLTRRHALASGLLIHNCEYPSTGDTRITGLLFLFILLPLLPVAVFIGAFGAGLAGVGGMSGVKERRQPQDEENGVQMVSLTTAHGGEPLLLKSRPDEPSSSDQLDPDWSQNLREIRASIEAFWMDPAFADAFQDQDYYDAAMKGMELSAIARYFGDSLGAQDYQLVNKMVLQFALVKLQALAGHLEERHIPPELIQELHNAHDAINKQKMINTMSNAGELLMREHTLTMQLDLDTTEGQIISNALSDLSTTVERQSELLNELLAGANDRLVRRLVALTPEELLTRLQQPQPELRHGGPCQQQVFAPPRLGDMAQPPKSCVSSSSFTFPMSTAPASPQTTAEVYHQDKLNQPPSDVGSNDRPSTSSESSTTTTSSSEEVRRQTSGEFIVKMMRANGFSIPPTYAQQLDKRKGMEAADHPLEETFCQPIRSEGLKDVSSVASSRESSSGVRLPKADTFVEEALLVSEMLPGHWSVLPSTSGAAAVEPRATPFMASVLMQNFMLEPRSFGNNGLNSCQTSVDSIGHGLSICEIDEPVTKVQRLDGSDPLSSASPDTPPPDPTVPETEKKSNRCGTCKTRVGLIGLSCSEGCGGVFCVTHHHSADHSCTLERESFKKRERERLAKVNQACVPEKIEQL